MGWGMGPCANAALAIGRAVELGSTVSLASHAQWLSVPWISTRQHTRIEGSFSRMVTIVATTTARRRVVEKSVIEMACPLVWW